MLKKHIAFVITLLFTTSLFSQSIKDLLNKETIKDVVGAVTGNNTIDLEGTWTYTGTAIEFQSDNVLMKAGSAVASSTIKKKIDAQLAKIGLKENVAKITFNTDSTFSLVTSVKTITGRYTVDQTNKKLDLDVIGGKGINPTIKKSGSQISLLMNGDKIVDLINFISTKTSNSTIKSISSLVNSYDGLLIGLEFSKK